MKDGTDSTTIALDDKGSSISTVKKYRHGNVEKAWRRYYIKVIVRNSQEEMTEFMRFTDELAKCRNNGTLTWDREDNATRPSFIIDYPKENRDGSYIIIKNYCVFDIH